jgi:hypothetical protein
VYPHHDGTPLLQHRRGGSSKPDTINDAHPASSKLDLFESFSRRIIDQVRSNKELWESTAILITFDEGGGYYAKPGDSSH